MIPEAVIEITSVTTRKIQHYANSNISFSYQAISPSLFWEYEAKIINNKHTNMIATPEKAILDLLYLYPQYNTENDMLELRLDADYIHEDLDIKKLDEYCLKTKNNALENRLKTLKKAYSTKIIIIF